MEQLAVRARRLVGLAFCQRVAHQLAQVLAIGLRKGGQKFGERVIALGQQAFAPALHPVQGGGVAAGLLAVGGKCLADGREGFGLEPAQLLGQELGLALAGNVRGDGARAAHLVGERVVQGEALEQRFGHRGQCLGQFQDVERVAPELAPAGFALVAGKAGIVHGGFHGLPWPSWRPGSRLSKGWHAAMPAYRAETG
jgi:hypothetical protein